MKKILIIFSLFTMVLQAQNQPDKVLNAGSSIDNMKLHTLCGVLIVNTSEGLSGIDVKTNETIWTIKNSDVKAKTMELLSDPDFMNFSKTKEPIEVIENSQFFSAKIKGNEIIVNATNGEIVFDGSSTSYFTVFNIFIPEKSKFLLVINEDKKYKALLYDFIAKKEDWKVELGDGKSKLFSLLGFNALDNNKVQIVGNQIYALITSKLYKIDYNTGKILWNLDEKINNLYFSRDEKNIIVNKKVGGLLSTKCKLNILNSETGSPVWKDDITTKYITYLEDWNTKILVAHYDGFNLFDYTTGKPEWKDDAEGKMIKKVISIDKDYLYVAQNEMMLIGPDGKNKWKKWIEISDDKEDEIVYLGKINGNVLYLSSTYGNMVDYQNGKKIWKGNIKFDKDRPLLYTIDEKKNVVIVYNDKDLYKFDPSIKDKPEPYSEVKCKSDKTMSGIELFDWGVALTSQNEVIGVNNDGSVKYQRIYRQPGEGTRKMLNTFKEVGAGALTVRAGIKNSLSEATVTMQYRNEKGELVTQTGYLLTEESRKEMKESANDDLEMASQINKLGSSFAERFKAMKQTSNYAILFAKDESADMNILVKIRKIDGEILAKIPVTGTKPLYEVDFATDNIYYVQGNEIQIFNKK